MTAKDEFILSARERIRTFNAFEKAAHKFLGASERVRQEKLQELIALSEETKSIREFLVQIEDESGQMGKVSFGLRYTNEEGKDHGKISMWWSGESTQNSNILPSSKTDQALRIDQPGISIGKTNQLPPRISASLEVSNKSTVGGSAHWLRARTPSEFR